MEENDYMKQKNQSKNESPCNLQPGRDKAGT